MWILYQYCRVTLLIFSFHSIFPSILYCCCTSRIDRCCRTISQCNFLFTTAPKPTTPSARCFFAIHCNLNRKPTHSSCSHCCRFIKCQGPITPPFLISCSATNLSSFISRQGKWTAFISQHGCFCCSFWFRII